MDDDDEYKRIHRLPSDDGKQYDFDFHALAKVKRRAKWKVISLFIVIVVLAMGLAGMVVLYHMKVINSNKTEQQVVYRNVTEALTDQDVKRGNNDSSK